MHDRVDHSYVARHLWQPGAAATATENPVYCTCSAVERLPDGQWRTKTAIAFGPNEVPADTFIGAGGNVDYVLVNGELINTDIADKCASRPG